MPEPQMLISLGKEVCEYVVHAFANGTLISDTSTGGNLQYCTAKQSTSTAQESVVESVDLRPFDSGFGSSGKILQMYFYLTGAFKTATDTGALIGYRWQAKEYALSDTCWVELAASSSTALGTTYVDYTYSGYFTPTTNLQNMPISVRLIIWGAEAGSTQPLGKTKSSSEIRVLYRVS